MNAGRWREIDELFEAALERTGIARREFLAGVDPALRPEVEQLLEADESARTFLERRTWLPDGPGEEAATALAAALPKRIGSYKVLGVLGEGGMGRVLLASRADDQYQRLVAIKTLRSPHAIGVKRGDPAAREELLARFDLERQALAQLEHPNIARLYDAGHDEAGDPYLVLEHIDGVPIDEYCDHHCLDVEARLRLFLEVCAAVQAAHRNLLVHRDLKPSNILVTADGRPMLLDFGIAKLLDPGRIAGELLDRELFETREGSRPMTPGYASPEQVKGEPITTASDVYSLGVLLYELLTGRKPYRVTGWAPRELEKAICETPPERPSTAIFRQPAKSDTRSGLDAVEPEELARRRGTSPPALARLLRGDLDTLLHTALRKDPDLRYASVEALGQDIAAYLGGKPLAARPPNRFYSFRKFIGRHRFAAAAAVALLVLVAGFLAALMIQARNIRAESDKARQALAFLVEVFKASDPSRAQGEELKAREILDGAARRIEKELAAQPEIQATLMDAMGQVYLGLGLYRDAGALLGKALALRHELDAEDPATFATQAHLAKALAVLGRLPEARELYEGAAAGQLEQGSGGAQLAETRLGLGDVLHLLGREQDAIGQKEEALRLLAKEPALEAELAAAEVSLGTSLAVLRQDQRAGELFARAEERRRRLFGEGSLQVAEVKTRRGELARYGARYQEAIGLFDVAIAVQRRLLEPEHPTLLATLQQLAICYAYVGQAGASIPLYQEVLEKKLRRLGPDHPEVASTQFAMAGAYAVDEQLHESLELYERSLRTRLAVFGRHNQLYTDTLCSRADILRQLGRLDEAAADCRLAIEVQRTLEGSEKQVERGLLCLGQVAMESRDFAAATENLRPVYEARLKRLAPGEETLINAQIAYGCALAGLPRPAEAEPLLREAYAQLVGRNKHSSRAGRALECLAPVVVALGRPDAAKVQGFLADSHSRGPLER
jgi:serine/threonine protein kinase/tetratricopeptide (TPR) repeat protein